MDNNNNNNKSIKESAANVKKEFKRPKDLTDVTIIKTPLPQATSTIDKRSLVQKTNSRISSNSTESTNNNNKQRQLNFENSNNVSHNSDETSLGILDGISTCTNLLSERPSGFQKKESISKSDRDQERELAFKVLQKYNEPIADIFSKVDKENNVNSSNLPMITVENDNGNNTKNIQASPSQNKSVNESVKKKSTTIGSMVFEPTEIAGCSTEFNSEKGEFSFLSPESKKSNGNNNINNNFTKQNFSGISYSSNLTEMQAQFGDEEFISGSKAGNKLYVDELSWRKNKFEPLPKSKNENERHEFSCFSGIIGSGDIIVDDGQLSIGEFFQQKSGAVGNLLSNNFSGRPSLGFDAKSPQNKGKCHPIIDKTTTSEDKIEDCTQDPTVMSLSSIARLLQNMEPVTPVRLVDQIMAENKKAKKKRDKVYFSSKTFTVPESKSTLQTSPSNTNINNSVETERSKLSQDSKNYAKIDDKVINELPKIPGISDQKLRNLLGIENINDSSTINEKSYRDTSYQQNNPKSSNESLSSNSCKLMPSLRWKLSQMSHNQNDFSKTPSKQEKSSFICDKESIELDDVESKSLKNSSKETSFSSLLSSKNDHQSFDTKEVKIGKKTQELCTCLVGIPREADFELCNGTDRWIICNFQVHQIQGEKDNIKLSLPSNEQILIQPHKQQLFKIGVKMPLMGKLVIVVLHIFCKDMVTKNNWIMKHLMCFVPEEPDIKMLIPSNDNFLNFQMLTEDGSNRKSISLENRNSIDVPVILRLKQDKPELFSINDNDDKTLSNDKKSLHLVLKPKMMVTINIDFKFIESFKEIMYQKNVNCIESTLSLSTCFKENEEHLVKEIKLKGFLGTCKLDIIDTQFPLVLQPKVVKLINVKNSGSTTLTATINIVQSIEDESESRDFVICPNNITLDRDDKLALQIIYKPENNKTDVERHAKIKIVVQNKISFYPIVGEKITDADSYLSNCFTNLPRSDSPHCLKSIGSPTSPQSICFDRSGTMMGRQSPCSTASSNTATDTKTIVPIRATHTSLIWGSIKIGKSDTKQFTIQNTSNTKIKLYITIKSDSQCFKFSKDRRSSSASIILSLKGMESKTLFVVFTPTNTKAAVGKIVFSHHSLVKESREISGLVKIIYLYGYGGYGKVEITGAIKDTSGQMWLSLGKLDSDGTLCSKVQLCNSGDLTCFVKAKLIPKALHPSVVSIWNVEPREILLGSRQVQPISVQFRPNKDDFFNMHQQTGVVHVGTLKLIHGDEPTRLRIRRLYKKLRESDQFHGKIDEDEYIYVIEQLSKIFPGENLIEDLKLIGDSVNNLGDLSKGIIQSEIKLTVEVQTDETMSIIQDNVEDCETFYSLYNDEHDNNFKF